MDARAKKLSAWVLAVLPKAPTVGKNELKIPDKAGQALLIYYA